jgi:hypothetical protein
MVALLEPFMPRPDVRARHEILVKAPAPLVLEVARAYDLQSHPLVRAIFWLRTKLLHGRRPAAWRSRGLVADTLSMGWGRLAEEPDRYFIAGATCQPWQADVIFTPIPPDRFAAVAAPDQVKIAWTLEVEALGAARTRLATETRAVATDEAARRKFRRYWRLFSVGIRMIRWLLLPAIRREAERRWRG